MCFLGDVSIIFSCLFILYYYLAVQLLVMAMLVFMEFLWHVPMNPAYDILPLIICYLIYGLPEFCHLSSKDTLIICKALISCCCFIQLHLINLTRNFGAVNFMCQLLLR